MAIRTFSQLRTLLVSLMALPAFSCFAGEVEVLHFWTSGGEAAAMEVLKDKVRASGHEWHDFTVVGGGGDNARSALASRVLMQDPPASTIIKGYSIQTWAQLNYLAYLDDIASEGNWDAHLPPVVADVMKFNDRYVATPVNVHRTNWMWVNKAILEEVGAAVPETWAEFEALAERIQAAGYSVIAHGDQAWQDATLFEAVALGVGGAEFYQQAFVAHDRSALRSPTMEAVFEQMNRLRPYIATDLPGQDWDVATTAVINGDAAFQFMGDWALGEFRLAGKRPGVDYLCVPTPQTQDMFIFNIDSFAMFQLSNLENADAQNAFARIIMEDEFQMAFNKAKGSIPARTDIALNGFEDCAIKSQEAFIKGSEKGTLVPSIAHGMATTEQIATEAVESVAYAWTNNLEPREARKQLGKSIRYGMYLLK